MANDSITILRINDELKERIKRAANQRGLSMSAYIRMVVIESLKPSLSMQDENEELSVDEMIEMFKQGTRKVDALALEALEDFKRRNQ